MVNVTKLYPSQDATAFQAFGRVISGTCKFSVCTVHVFNFLSGPILIVLDS